MLQTVLNKVWLLILAYGAWNIWVAYEEHTTRMKEISDSIPQIQSQINRARKEKKQIRFYLRDIEEAKKNIELVAQEVEKLQKKLPEAIKDTENLGYLKDLADGLNIKKIYLSPGTEQNQGFYYTKKYEFSGTGTFLQFLILLEKIGNSERLLNVKELNFKRSEEKQRGRFQLTNARFVVEAYRYNPNHKEDRGIRKVEEQFKASKGKKRRGRGQKGKKGGKKK